MSTAEEQSALRSKGARDWAEVQEGMVAPLYQTVLARLQIKPKTQLLDVGCGAGLFCQMAAAQGAVVTGIDATDALLAIARKRTKDAQFRVGDMEDLPFAEAQFDVVTGFNSFQFAGSPLNALRQVRRVLKPEGVLAIAIWAGPQHAQVAACFKALAALLPPPPPGAPGPFVLSGPDVLEPLVAQAGFRGISLGPGGLPVGLPRLQDSMPRAAFRRCRCGGQAGSRPCRGPQGAGRCRCAVPDSSRRLRAAQYVSVSAGATASSQRETGLRGTTPVRRAAVLQR